MDATTVFRGKHLVVRERDGWEFVERMKAKEAVAIIAITDDDAVILTEQFRRPVDATVIDLPAGLIEEGGAEKTALRELEEETGFTCERVERLASGPTSPGISSEVMHLYRAIGVKRRGKGGGVDGEKITVHLVPLGELESWLRGKSGQGFLVDIKLLLCSEKYLTTTLDRP
jgi:ADP-ribose pyrophosphatase